MEIRYTVSLPIFYSSEKKLKLIVVRLNERFEMWQCSNVQLWNTFLIDSPRGLMLHDFSCNLTGKVECQKT